MWEKEPFPERARKVCLSWALQGYGTPLAIYAVYALKVAFYIGAWIFFCRFTPGLGSLSDIGAWWLSPVAFQKAIVWSLLFEILGLGCGSGPLTGRYYPPIGGFLYFLRLGTTKLPLFENAPLVGGRTRNALDVLVYAALLVALVRALVSPEPGVFQFLPIAVLMSFLGVLDKTLFLAARSEHYLATVLCFIFAPNWIAGAKAVQAALWFWAGFSKLNRHFPAVVCVMTSNSPILRFEWLRRRMYVNYPDDLRPSRLAAVMGHIGTALELSVPWILLFSPGGTSLVVGMILMLMLHGYITSNVPMGVPIEWNFMVVYGAFALFWAHPDITVLQLGSVPFGIFLALALVGVPLVGNLWPDAISFLLAMRYYAGNWACSVYLFRGNAHEKLARLKKSSGWIYDQLDRFYDRATSVGLVGKVIAFRLMHLHGRALAMLLPKVVDRVEDYQWADGEIVAGLALGYNFGDGHLHRDQLLRNLQAQCGFEPGELRCIFLEAQPFLGKSQHYRLYDAATGKFAEGDVPISEMLARQPWPTPNGLSVAAARSASSEVEGPAVRAAR